MVSSDSVQGRSSVQVALGDRSYEIVISSGELGDIAATCERWMSARGRSVSGKKSAFVITDENVEQTHAATVVSSLKAAGWDVAISSVSPGETAKSLDNVSKLYDRLIDRQADRNTVTIAVGGGVVGDLAGFVASSYARGIPFVQVPTTLLAQVDSSVGGKVGVNHPRAKNMIGAFYQPFGVYVDTSTLITLPDREYRAGLAEVVKYGVILDDEFFRYLEANVDAINQRDPLALRHIVSRSCRLKADVVEQDEYELSGLRAVLNYGHTFGHAFEALCGYGELLHGEGVSIGMEYAAELALELGRIDAEFVSRQTRLLEALHLPTRADCVRRIDPAEILERMRLDKKTVGGQLRFVLPTRIGHVELVKSVPESTVSKVLNARR